MKVEEYLETKGMANVGHYGLLITDPSKQKMHQIMEDYADKYHKAKLQDPELRDRIYREELEKHMPCDEEIMKAFSDELNGAFRIRKVSNPTSNVFGAKWLKKLLTKRTSDGNT